MPEVKPNDIDSEAKIKVVGVGGAGGHAIDRMREVGLSGVELIAVNTDAQQLRSTKADVKVPLHMDSTKGLGAGADPAKGEKAADESREDIKKALEGAPEGSEIIVLIGPEGDFSPAEAASAISRGFVPIHLGDSRLRTETAAVTAAEAVYFNFMK